MARGTHSASRSDYKTIYTFFTALIGLFMLVIPFYSGLFFRTEYLPAIAIISFVFAAYMFFSLKDRKNNFIGTYLDISVLLIPVVYLISFFFAVNTKDAFDMFLLYCSYFMLYKLVSALSIKDERYKSVFINIIIASAFILSFTSMLNISGIINLQAAFEGRRLFGLYQYPNTTASVLGVGIILSLNKLISEANFKLKAIYQGALTALLPAFIFTLSRGGYLVLAAVLILNFLLINARLKVKLLLGLFVSSISIVFFIYKYYSIPNEALSVVWVYYLISIIASSIITHAIYNSRNLIKIKFTDKAMNMTLLAMALVFAGTAVFLFSAREPMEYKLEHTALEEKSWKIETINLDDLQPNTTYNTEFSVKASAESQTSFGVIINSYNEKKEKTEILQYFGPTGPEFVKKGFEFKTAVDTDQVSILLYNYETNSFTVYKDVLIKDSNGQVVKRMEKFKYIPSAIAERLTDISLRTETVSLRANFAKDAMKIIADYPILGAGGGAWRNLYRHYQTLPYDTTEVHNFYMQYGTEVGIIGLAVLIGLLVLLVISMIKSVKSNSRHVGIYLAAMLILLHSSIDFNLSLPAVAYILWMLVGVINSDKNTPLPSKFSLKHLEVLALILSLAILLSSSLARHGMSIAAQGATTSEANKDTDKAIELYRRAAKYDRYNGMIRIDLAQLYNKKLKDTQDSKYYDDIMEQIDKLRKYEPYSHGYTSTICNIMLSLGKFDEVSKLADLKVIHEPLLIQSYSIKIDANFEIVRHYAQKNMVQNAVPYLKKIVEARDQLKRVNETLIAPMVLDEKTIEKIETSSKVLELMDGETKK